MCTRRLEFIIITPVAAVAALLLDVGTCRRSIVSFVIILKKEQQEILLIVLCHSVSMKTKAQPLLAVGSLGIV